MSLDKDVLERSVELERLLPFKRELVWKALTDPEHVNQWWGPDGFKNVDVQWDFKVGGVWSYTMVGPDGTRYPNRVHYKEIEAPAKMVFDHGDDKSVWFETTITLEEKDGGTRYFQRQVFPNKERRDEVVEKYGAIEGGKQHLAKLEAYIRTNLI
jgi:uncharacterized protein YndB with AHSA1/START domain